MRSLVRWILQVSCIATLVAGLLPWSPGYANLPENQESPEFARARSLLERMTPEERVGQLFVVSMQGTNINERSQIYDLITNYHIGGVMLLRANENFINGPTAALEAYQLTSGLQAIEWQAALNPRVDTSGNRMDTQYVPLFIGMSQEGDSYPNDQLFNGVTALPSLMSIGATWNPTLARQVGVVMGREMEALGVNLYLGPSLDVLDLPQMESGDNLGVRTFGGDPYWVSKMGQAYIAGLHAGSSQRLAVIAKHFPGRGGSDRSPEEEIATVRKSLERLKQFELSPFFSVTGEAANPEMVTDGLLVSHIRYQGFQGNIRATTKPVSFDKAALDLIMQEAPFASWRSAGGLVVSDDLGSQAVRRFYETTGSPFDALQVAREAVYAGNDLLYVNRMVMSPDRDNYTTTVRTLQFFAQKYRSDPEFARRIDVSVERILALKYRIYPDFDVDAVVPAEDHLEMVGRSPSSSASSGEDISFQVARQAVTLISPNVSELSNVLPDPPQARERIVFLTDVHYGQQCNLCPEQVTLPVDGMQTAVLRLYGQQGTRQVSHSLMSSYSFSDLWKMMNGSVEVPTLEEDLLLADWVVVGMLKPDASRPDSDAFRRLLSNRPDLLRNKKVVVFAFNAPYYLDATDISKITAYYGVYGKTPAFVEVAARVLFQEVPVTGTLPVSVPGIGYDLINATSPDPNQVIPLFIDPSVPNGTATPQATVGSGEPLTFRVGDIIPLRTGIIYDHNRNTVPDNTPVSFLITVITENGTFNQQLDQVTTDGVARLMYRIDQTGVLDIRVTSGQGATSDILRLNLTGGEAVPTFLAPPTQTPTPTPTATVTPTPTETPTPTPTVIPAVHMQVTDWFFASLFLLGLSAVVVYFGMRLAIARWGLRWALCGLIGGMLAYNYLAFDLPGSQDMLQAYGTTGVILFTILGAVIGWAVGLVWRQVTPLPSDRSQTGERRSATGPRSQSS